MNKREIFDFLESYQIFKIEKNTTPYTTTFDYKEVIENKIIGQVAYVNDYYGILDIYLMCLGKKMIQKQYTFNLSDDNIKEEILYTILEFYGSEGITPTNLLPYVREKKIGEILE